MTSQNQIKAIAELVYEIRQIPIKTGSKIGYGLYRIGSEHCITSVWRKEEPNLIEFDLFFDDWLNSRDAIVPVLEKQPYEIKEKTLLNLDVNVFDGWSHHVVVKVMLATPQQLCEALLRATGKWKD